MGGAGLMLTRRDAAAIIVISVAFLVVAAFYVGAGTPSTSWRVKPENVYVTFRGNVSVKAIYLYINGDTNNATVFISQNTAAGWKTVGYVNNQGYFKWIASTEMNVVTDSLRLYLWVGEDIYEIVAVDEAGATIPIVSWSSDDPQDTGVARLFDEQGLFEYTPTFRDQTLFDEVYFVRAAQDYLAQQETHEWTHPPLGKLIIAAGIALFSFSPIGWRVMSVVFATLMIPVVYAAGLAIFKTRFAATAAALLLALDFMHFTMGRIGTVDTFLVFFSTVSLLFFYVNFEGMMKGEKPSTRHIFLGALFASLAISVKWTSAFAVAGQVLLIAFAALVVSPGGKSAVDRLRALVKPAAITALSFAFGGLIYFATYIPWLTMGHTLGDLFNLQLSMLGFHSTLPPGHLFASAWTTWPLILRPMRFSLDHLPGAAESTINAMGNPLIWWFGFAAIILSVVNAVKDRKSNFMFLVVIYLAQLLPYALISRDTFIYHYYPEVPILALAIAGVLDEFWAEPGARKYIVLYFVAVAVVFVAYYPVISGYPAPTWYIRVLKLFQGWDFLGV
jgi:predicted membrane-bound dolichyl-phosphate-mannose-protein mannosyltransferase